MNLAIWIPEWVERLGWVLVHFVWQGLLIGILSWAGTSLLKKSSAQSRYLLLCAALLSCILCPCITWTILAENAHSNNTRIKDLSFDPIQAHVTSVSALTTIEITPEITAQKFSPSFRQTLVRLEGFVVSGLPYLVTLWSVGVMLLSLRLLIGWLQIQRLCASGVPVAERTWEARLNLLSEKMGMCSKITLLESILIEVPTVIGSLRPVILVPVTFMTGLPTDQIEAILVHELAHIRRHDYFVNLIQIAVETLLFYHPAVWWISNSIREERENCCDDLALRVIGDKTLYVSALAALEESRSLPMAITMSAAGGSLLQRIRRIMGVGGGKDSSWLVLAALLFVAVATNGAAWEAKQQGQDEKMASNGPAGQTNTVIPPREVEIEAQLYQGTPSDLKIVGVPSRSMALTNNIYMHGMALTGIFTPEQTRNLLRKINKQRGVILISAPKVTLLSGRKARISTDFSSTPLGAVSPSQVPDGFQLDVQPAVGPDGQTIDLHFSIKLKRQGKVWYANSEISIFDRQTAVMEGGMPGDGNLCELMLISARVVKPTGEPLAVRNDSNDETAAIFGFDHGEQAIYSGKLHSHIFTELCKGSYPEVSPSGRFVSYNPTDSPTLGNPPIKVVEISTGKVISFPSIPIELNPAPESFWSKDERRIAFKIHDFDGNRDTCVVDLTDGSFWRGTEAEFDSRFGDSFGPIELGARHSTEGRLTVENSGHVGALYFHPDKGNPIRLSPENMGVRSPIWIERTREALFVGVYAWPPYSDDDTSEGTVYLIKPEAKDWEHASNKDWVNAIVRSGEQVSSSK